MLGLHLKKVSLQLMQNNIDMDTEKILYLKTAKKKKVKLTFHTGSIGTVFLDIGLFKLSILLKEAAMKGFNTQNTSYITKKNYHYTPICRVLSEFSEGEGFSEVAITE